MNVNDERENMDNKTALERFADHLPAKPYCAEKITWGMYIRPKEIALDYPLIQLNRKLRFYLPFDIDRVGAAFTYEEANLPAPTLTMINRKNAHAHAAYELECPVSFHDQ